MLHPLQTADLRQTFDPDNRNQFQMSELHFRTSDCFLVFAWLLLPAVLWGSDIVLTFDDLPAYSQVGEQYASYGIHFAPTDWGVVPGLVDSEWQMQGTNGPYFLGFDSSSLSVFDITSDFPISRLSFKVTPIRAAAYGPWPLVFDFQTFADGQIVSTSDPETLGTDGWTTFTFIPPVPITELRFRALTLVGQFAYPIRYGIDDFEVTQIRPLDSDGDGVPDNTDLCPDTTTGVIVDRTGCSIDQLNPCAGPRSGGTWRNHGEYVSAVTKTAKAFLALAFFTQEQADTVIAAAAKSNCGKK